MTELSLSQWEMPTADVGGVNPLPPLFGARNLEKTADMAGATEEIRTNAGYGRVRTICPYLLQDGYHRHREPKPHPVAVLENEHLRATFLLNAGGRMWSLVHQPTGTDLLFTNPIFQPANLALRNAWVAGGVEWNIGTIGHTPSTCEPMHAARVLADDGSPVLRLYEFERLRRVVYQIDVHLPPHSHVLFVHVRIVNPNSSDVPMYWWSNIAVPQTEHTRVLAPADRAWGYSYDNVMRHEPVADTDGSDMSYPARARQAADYFFDLAGHQQPWIAAVGQDGTGLFQTSSSHLMGRKLFRWGTGPGGRRWQEWLTGSPEGYAEIQAGLARTQFEHLRMPAGATWSWTEGYGRIEIGAADAHAPWQHARVAAEKAVTGAVTPEQLHRVNADAEALADRPPEKLLHIGSGWGALERRIRMRSGEPALGSLGTPFPDESLGEDQQPWVALLDSGTFPSPDPGAFPTSLHLHPAFVELLAASPGWAAPALLGVIRACAGDLDGARTAWRESLKRSESAYARRNLAIATLHEGDADSAVGQYELSLHAAADPPLRVVEPLRASGSAATHPALVIEMLRAMIASDAAERALALIDSLPVDLRARGRIRLLEATAALQADELGRCGTILTDEGLQVADLREGEDSLPELWWDYQTKLAAARRGMGQDQALHAEIERTVTVPTHLDFRMHAASG